MTYDHWKTTEPDYLGPLPDVPESVPPEETTEERRSRWLLEDIAADERMDRLKDDCDGES